MVMTVDWIDNVGRYSSIVIGDNGHSVISYLDSSNNDMKVVPMWFLAQTD
jgi:hypothetical protein